MGKEAEAVGREFGKEMEAFGKRVSRTIDRVFGPAWPLVSALIGFLVFTLVLGVLSIFAATPEAHVFWTHVVEFLTASYVLVLALTFAFGFGNAFAKLWRPQGKWLEPLLGAAGILVGFWFATQIVAILGTDLGNPVLQTLAGALWILAVFLAVLVPAVQYVTLLGRLRSSRAPGGSGT